MHVHMCIDLVTENIHIKMVSVWWFYMKNGCFTKLPWKTGIFPGYIYIYIYVTFIFALSSHNRFSALRDPTFQVLKGQGMLKAIRPFRNKNER